KIFGASAELQHCDCFRDQFGSTKSYNLCPEQSISFRIRQYFCKALALVIGKRATIGSKRKSANFDCNSVFLCEFLGLANAGYLRICVDDIRYRGIVYMTRL